MKTGIMFSEAFGNSLITMDRVFPVVTIAYHASILSLILLSGQLFIFYQYLNPHSIANLPPPTHVYKALFSTHNLL